jgi:hypothetical protein
MKQNLIPDLEKRVRVLGITLRIRLLINTNYKILVTRGCLEFREDLD